MKLEMKRIAVTMAAGILAFSCAFGQTVRLKQENSIEKIQVNNKSGNIVDGSDNKLQSSLSKDFVVQSSLLAQGNSGNVEGGPIASKMQNLSQMLVPMKTLGR